MGQEQLNKLKQELDLNSYIDNLPKNSRMDFIKKIIDTEEGLEQKPLTVQRIQYYLNYYTQWIGQAQQKRRRSFELHIEELPIETDAKKQQFQEERASVEEEMDWLEQIQEEIRNNIIQVMSTRKVFKIRQKFRKLILKLLKIDNLMIYITHCNGKLEFHDFQENYVTEIIERGKISQIEGLMGTIEGQQISEKVYEQFDLLDKVRANSSMYKWSTLVSNGKYRLCFVWKNHSELNINQLNSKIMEKIASICLISLIEQQECTIIINYSKYLLDILEHLINQSQTKICSKINKDYPNLHQIQEWLASQDKTYDQLSSRITSFQQQEYELLERIRMYKKYVCQNDKIFLDFNSQAQLTFISNNFDHVATTVIATLYGKRQLYIQTIFKQNKLINNFLKKATQNKVKGNKLYELDFETKARVKYDSNGKISRFHVIIQQLENIAHNRKNSIYNFTSSFKLLSQSQIRSDDEDSGKEQSLLITSLSKENPRIIEEGWINLFIVDNKIIRKKNIKQKYKRSGYSRCNVKRTYSLNTNLESCEENDNRQQSKQILPNINIESINLNLLELDEEYLQSMVIKVFNKLQFFNDTNVNRTYFDNFLFQLHNLYQVNNNPFHNFTHGVNVMHTSYLLSNTPKIKQILTPMKMFTIVFSGLCHDVGHTGFTNLFEIASNSKKAVTYNDNSPLENYHAAATFQILRKPENNFLKEISAVEFKNFRKSVINNILSTDIKQHFPLLKKFDLLVKDEIPESQEYTNILSAMIIHTSDFGGSAKEFEISKEWSLRINLEFSNQYKIEGELGFAQTPFMKDLQNITHLSKNQSGFLKVIVLPLFQAMDQFSGVDFNVKRLRQYVESNIKVWQGIHTNSLVDTPNKQEQ